METSYLRVHLFGNRYPEWMPSLPSNRGQDSNPCIWKSPSPPEHTWFYCTTAVPCLYNSFYRFRHFLLLFQFRTLVNFIRPFCYLAFVSSLSFSSVLLYLLSIKLLLLFFNPSPFFSIHSLTIFFYYPNRVFSNGFRRVPATLPILKGMKGTSFALSP